MLKMSDYLVITPDFFLQKEKDLTDFRYWVLKNNKRIQFNLSKEFLRSGENPREYQSYSFNRYFLFLADRSVIDLGNELLVIKDRHNAC
jgi:hypothetical protein